MRKLLLLSIVLLPLLACQEKEVQLEPDEVVGAFLKAVENRDASTLVSYLSEGEIMSLEPFVEEIKYSSDPNSILNIAGIELSEEEIEDLDAVTFYELSFEAHWDVMERMNIDDTNVEYLIDKPRISGDSAFIEFTRKMINADETNVWVLLKENDYWKIDSYEGL